MLNCSVLKNSDVVSVSLFSKSFLAFNTALLYFSLMTLGPEIFSVDGCNQ